MEYYSVIKRNAFESVLMRWMNLEPIIQSEVSQGEKQISYINAYIWNLERWYWWTYLQGSNGDTDIKNRRKDKSGGAEEEGGTNGESNMEAYTLCCVLAQSCSTLCNPMDCSLPGSSVHGDPPGKNPGVGCHALLQRIFPTQGIQPRSPALQVDSLPTKV